MVSATAFAGSWKLDFHDLGGDIYAYTGNHHVGKFNRYF